MAIEPTHMGVQNGNLDNGITRTFRWMAISGTDWLEVPTIYKAYFLGLCKGISPKNMALYGTVPPFQDPEIPIDMVLFPLKNQDLTRKKRPFLLLHMKGKLTRDTKISQTRLGVWGSRLDGWVSLPSQKRWTYPGVMGFSSISLRCWDGSISFSTAMSTSQHSTLDDGFSSKDLGDVETKRCENVWKFF
jgi:hypothetical protein